MQTFSQICAGLGYKSYHEGYKKLSKAGVELASLPRFIGEDKRTVFYDDKTAEYLKSVIKPCNRKCQAAMQKRLDAKKVPVQMQDPEQKTKKRALKAKAKPENQAVNAVGKVSTPNENAVYNQRFQQIKVLGDLLFQQIDSLSRDMATAFSGAKA